MAMPPIAVAQEGGGEPQQKQQEKQPEPAERQQVVPGLKLPALPIGTSNVGGPPKENSIIRNIAAAQEFAIKTGVGGAPQEAETAVSSLPGQRESGAENRETRYARLAAEAAHAAETAAAKLSCPSGRFQEGDDGGGGEEILRAMEKVNNAQRRRTGDGAHDAKRQTKREELARKRAEMEARIQEEEGRLTALAQKAKEKVQAGLISAEAKSDAAARMKAEAEARVAMEREAEELARKRADLEASQAAATAQLQSKANDLAAKRAEIEMQMRIEEQEVAKLSEDARRKVEERMAQEAAAIAAMELQAAQLAARREALAVQVRVEQELVAREESSFDNEEVGHQGRRLRFASSAKSLYDLMAEEVTAGSSILPQRINEEPTSDPEEMEGAVLESAGHGCAPEGMCDECRSASGELLPVHTAAVEGHAPCLEAVLQFTAGAAIVSEDGGGRCPLFYAAANGRQHAVELLISKGASAWHSDHNGDTPLHGAAASGHVNCLRILLKSGPVLPLPTNSLRMTPAHLAASREIMETLLEYGADLGAQDSHGRTPLFFAAATDRIEVADFLCDFLDVEGRELGTPDSRGDTPLHAAACNGATACVLLLLQYGTAPSERNLKGMRPIDLAARRGHTAAEKILAEYQLHHAVGNSYFDSVLFLATLEGHKKAKLALEAGAADKIVNSADITSISHGEDPSLVKQKSMWSLRRGRSMRLQQWGDWIAYEDQETHSLFWYNHATQATQWERPPAVEALQRQDAEAQVGNFKELAKASMRLKREGDWINYTIANGRHFYYNDKTNEFQWERPVALLSQGIPGESAEEVGSSWTPYKDPNSGLIFWYDHVTGRSQWEPPEGCTDTQVPADTGEAEPEAVREVTDVDELFTPR